MAGSIRPRPDRGHDAWEIRVFIGRDTAGRAKHVSRLVRGGKRFAENELARLWAEVDRNPPVLGQPVPTNAAEQAGPVRRWGPDTTINDAIAAWKDARWSELSPVTTMRYESIWRRYVDKTLGPRPILDVTPYDAECFFRQLKAGGLGPASVRYTKAMLNRACRLARKWSAGALVNPFEDADLPRWSLEERPKAVRSPTPEEVGAILRAAAADGDRRAYPFCRLVAATGMRRGEAAGLRWGDVDRRQRQVTIRGAVIGGPGGATLKGPKTAASIRVVSVDAATLEALEAFRSFQLDLAQACGEPLTGKSFVFAYEPGGADPPHPDTFSKMFQLVRARAGVPADLHLHSLRHFQATTLDSVISERQKQARLGWSTVHMARHYTSAVAEADAVAADHMAQVLDASEHGRNELHPESTNSTHSTKRSR